MTLLRCTYRLNGERSSTLSCPGVGFFPAFSGNGPSTNNPGAASVPGVGPLPVGKYFIVLRGRGGTYSRIRDSVRAMGTGSDRSEWFALYRDDGLIDDATFIEGVRRGEFRLHPIGPSGQSKGCITLYNQSHFKLIAGALLRTPGEIVPGTNLIAHGVVQVY